MRQHGSLRPLDGDHRVQIKKPREVDQPYEALFGDLKVFSPLGAMRQPVLGDYSFAGNLSGRIIRHVEP